MENLIKTSHGGRPGDPRLGDLTKVTTTLSPSKGKETLVIFGCPDDTGVTRNRGRAGAKSGPDGIRKHFFKMTPPMDFEWEKTIELCDYGNLTPTTDIVETHRRCHERAGEVGKSGATIMALGGGHDFAAPNFLGFLDGVTEKSRKKSRWGLINVDPHLDVRELDDGKPHSGTPFRQILESGALKGPDFVQFGIRRNRNARPHFEYCASHKVRIECYEDLRRGKQTLLQSFEKNLKALASQCDAVGVTIDLDSCAEAEGTSAAPVIGFSAWDLVEFAGAAGRNPHVRYFEIAEASATLEATERACRVAAEILFAFVNGRSIAKRKKG